MFEIALALVPLLLLVGALLLGHYPGVDAIVRLSERIAPRRALTRHKKPAPSPRSPLPRGQRRAPDRLRLRSASAAARS